MIKEEDYPEENDSYYWSEADEEEICLNDEL